MSKKSYPGVNIQWPISELILSGEKNVETRTYPIPEKYLNKEMFLIETPGPKGKFKARTRALIIFTKCFQYRSKKEFYNDFDRHKVKRGSLWDWRDKDKWAWELEIVKIFDEPKTLTQKKGIVFTSTVSLYT